MKHVFKLTAEEQAMHDAVDWNSVRPITAEENKRLQEIARNTTARK